VQRAALGALDDGGGDDASLAAELGNVRAQLAAILNRR
jgi:hypothetical protein